ncbi:MAG: hypothetical protein JXJ04_20125 [Spirochaetales bacterium]|nr:hypothetical protein [Spirochaetales bacterium]
MYFGSTNSINSCCFTVKPAKISALEAAARRSLLGIISFKITKGIQTTDETDVYGLFNDKLTGI